MYVCKRYRCYNGEEKARVMSQMRQNEKRWGETSWIVLPVLSGADDLVRLFRPHLGMVGYKAVVFAQEIVVMTMMIVFQDEICAGKCEELNGEMPCDFWFSPMRARRFCNYFFDLGLQRFS